MLFDSHKNAFIYSVTLLSCSDDLSGMVMYKLCYLEEKHICSQSNQSTLVVLIAPRG